MEPTQAFIERLGAQGIWVWLEGDQIQVSAPIAVLSPGLREELQARRAELLVALRGEMQAEPRVGAITPRADRNAAPLSFAQQRLWFLNQLEPDQPIYNMAFAYRASGELDIAALEHAIGEIVRRHEVLRTTYVNVAGTPVQMIRAAEPFVLDVLDLRSLPVDSRQEEVRRLAAQERLAPFDLATGPLLRARLMRLNASEYVLLLSVHHITFDAWSSGIFARELSALYAAYAAGRPSPLPELPVQYADFAAWQRQRLQGQALDQHLAFWRRQLDGLQPLEVPTDRPRPATPDYRGAGYRFAIEPDLDHALRRLAASEGASLYMLLLAAFQVLLQRYSGQNNIAVGTPIANRTAIETQDLIGFFANTLVMRGDLSGNPAFRALLRRIRGMVLDAFDHQDLPFERLVEAIQPERSLNRNPLFQVLFQVLSGRDEAVPELPGVTLRPTQLGTGAVRFDLELHLSDSARALSGQFVYSTSLFDAETIQRLAGHYVQLLRSIVQDPDQPIGALQIMDGVERRLLLVDWNGPSTDYPREACAHHLFEAQAARTPDAVAAEFEGQRLTYAQLDARANQLAHVLAGNGIGPASCVGLCLDRSLDLAVGILATLKAGAACVPMDAAHPSERVAMILEDAPASVLVVHEHLRDRFAAFPGRVLALDAAGSNFDQEPVTPALVNISSDQPAYVLFTSGSTGRPKGVAMPHRALVNLIGWHQQHPRLGRPSRTMQLSPITFDVSFQELFTTWCTGGTVVFIREEAHRDPGLLIAALNRERIDRVFVPYVMLQLIAETAQRAGVVPAGLRDVISAGEQLRLTTDIRALFSRLDRCLLHNHYGPTETHLATAHTLEAEPGAWPAVAPIGRPISNARIYLVDHYGQLAPLGAPAEIYIGGDTLANGYLNQLERTAERFLPDPFCDAPNARMYRTGDLARWRSDGTLEFIGRADGQLKIRGFRVEPGEVEVALSRHPDVVDCAVVAQVDVGGYARLAAFYVPRHGMLIPAAELSSFLRRTLPDYMIPSVFLPLKEMPRSPNGKTDRHAMAMQRSGPPDGDVEHERALTPVEQKLAALWAEVLGVRCVGPYDNFFELGGHSLLAVRLFARIEQDFGMRLPLSTLFEHPSLEGLAAVLQDRGYRPDWRTVVPIQPFGTRPPFFCVHGFGGGVLGYAELARLLGPDQPFYGLQAAGLNGGEEPDRTIEAMAERYVAAMRAVQPNGPYRIGGYCFGGVVAYEMACQLERQGAVVEVLAVIEGYAPASTDRRANGSSARAAVRRPGTAARTRVIWHNIPFWFEDYASLGVRGVGRRIRRKVSGIAAKSGRGRSTANPSPQQFVDDDLSVLPDHHFKTLQAHVAALRAYIPGPYSGKVILFAARGKTFTRAVFGSTDPENGWRSLALGGVEVRPVDGGHRNVHLPPYVQSLASSLRASLASI